MRGCRFGANYPCLFIQTCRLVEDPTLRVFSQTWASTKIALLHGRREKQQGIKAEEERNCEKEDAEEGGDNRLGSQGWNREEHCFWGESDQIGRSEWWLTWASDGGKWDEERALGGGLQGRRRGRGWLVGWVSPRGPREGEEDGSTSAPPAEKLDRGSAFCFGEREEKRESPQQQRGAYFSRWRGFVQKAGGGVLLIQSAISHPHSHTHSYTHSAHLPTYDLTCNARQKKFSRSAEVDKLLHWWSRWNVSAGTTWVISDIHDTWPQHRSSFCQEG